MLHMPTPARSQPVPASPNDVVCVLPITQATAATFPDLYIGLTLLVFVQTGTKRVICPVRGEVIGEEGDLIVFPPGSMVTLENRPVLNACYRADGVCFSHDMIDAVFADERPGSGSQGIQILRAASHRPFDVLGLIKTTLDDNTLAPPIRRHRLLEPLVWLRHHGIRLQTRDEEQPFSQVRNLIETDLGHAWRASDVARHFAMSEATLRRWLASSGSGFSRILHNTRLERGLTLLQTTDRSISQIALECGFKTPSHFSDAFRKRFGIVPRAIRSN